MKYVYNVTMARTTNILISNWPRKRKFRQLFKTASREGQNLAGEFMQKIYTAFWNLFTLTAKADRLLRQLVWFQLSFSTGCTKLNTAVIKSLLLFMAGLFIEILVE